MRNLASDDYLVLAKQGGGFHMVGGSVSSRCPFASTPYRHAVELASRRWRGGHDSAVATTRRLDAVDAAARESARNGVVHTQGFIDTKIEIRDVYLYRPDKMFAGDGYLKVLPNGKKSLLDQYSIEAATAQLGYDKDYPVTVGATLYVKGPFGKAYTNVTVQLKRVRVPRVVGQLWVDDHAFNGLRGEDWGLDELFTKGGHLTWQCAVGSLQGFRLATKREVEAIDSPNNKPTKVHIGSASIAAVSDIPAFAELVEQGAALIYHKGNIADQEHVTVWKSTSASGALH